MRKPVQTNGPIKMEARVKRDSALIKVHELIDWKTLRAQVAGLYKYEAGRAGRQELMDPLVAFKAVLLGHWHNLSDPELEEALRLRIDFMHFCGLGLSDEVPDETVLGRFRNRLIASGRLAGLLAGVNSELRAHDLSVKCVQGAIIDVLLVRTAARPERDRVIELDTAAAPKVNEDGSIPCITVTRSPKRINCTGTRNADPDATWVRKGKKITSAITAT